MKITTLIIFVLVTFVVSAAQTPPRKLIETQSSDSGWEADMGALDQLSIALQSEPAATGYVILYGATRGYRNDITKRMTCMKNYLIRQRAIPPARLKVVNGGYREQVMFELWVAPDGAAAPPLAPTIKAKNIRLKAGRTKYTCTL